MPSKYIWTEKKIAAYYAEGRGQGRGAEYLSWLQVHDISSRGVSRRTYSRKCKRVVHTLSDIEFDFFLWLEWNNSITDIREQFPLDRELTRPCAVELGFKHPRQPREQLDTVMTVDFLVDMIENGIPTIKAFAVKEVKELGNKRSMQKLDIADAALASLGIEQHLVVDTQLPALSISNIKRIYQSEERDTEDPSTSEFLAEASQRFLRSLIAANANSSLGAHCEAHDGANGYLQGTSIRLANLLMLRRAIHAPLKHKVMLDCPISLLLNGAT